MNSLQGKKALVTGGASGIGKAIVEELASQGAEVFIHYHSSSEPAEQLAKAIKENGGVAYVSGADLTSEKEVKDLITKVAKSFGSLDILVNNAGDLVGRKLLEDMSIDFFRAVTAVNLDSMIMVIKETLPLMKDRGGTSIVNLSSEAGRKGWGERAGALAYSTTKGAILTLTRGLSAELAPYGIRVNAVAPGLILGSNLHSIHTAKETKENAIKNIPLKKAGTCEDTARAVVFLASEYDGFITGATLDINGGVYVA